MPDPAVPPSPPSPVKNGFLTSEFWQSLSPSALFTAAAGFISSAPVNDDVKTYATVAALAICAAAQAWTAVNYTNGRNDLKK